MAFVIIDIFKKRKRPKPKSSLTPNFTAGMVSELTCRAIFPQNMVCAKSLILVSSELTMFSQYFTRCCTVNFSSALESCAVSVHSDYWWSELHTFWLKKWNFFNLSEVLSEYYYSFDPSARSLVCRLERQASNLKMYVVDSSFGGCSSMIMLFNKVAKALRELFVFTNHEMLFHRPAVGAKPADINTDIYGGCLHKHWQICRFLGFL